MIVFVTSRLAQIAVVLVGVSLIAFTLLRLAPGDPGAFLYGPYASQEELAQLRERWGLDAPLHLQYGQWLVNVARGDLGRSYADGRPVVAVIGDRLPATLLLGATALSLATILGVLLGVLSATYYHSWVDRLITVGVTALYSAPPFWLGLLLVFIFSFRLNWLPSGGLHAAEGDNDLAALLAHLALPAVALSIRDAGRIARVTRVSVLETRSQEYVRTAVAKGLTPTIVTTRHILRNSLLPILSLIGVAIPGLLGGVVVIETVFNWPGLGRLTIESALRRDYSVLMGEVLVVTALAVSASLLTDVAHRFADPRLRRPNGG